MNEFKPIKATELPLDLSPNSLYFVKGDESENFKIYATTNTDPVAAIPLDAITKDEVESLIYNSSGELKFEFSAPLEVWNVPHFLNRLPIPNIIIDGQMVHSDVQYIDNDNLRIVHFKPQTGLVIIRR